MSSQQRDESTHDKTLLTGQFRRKRVTEQMNVQDQSDWMAVQFLAGICIESIIEGVVQSHFQEIVRHMHLSQVFASDD
jgi:hypothetical protein